MPNDKPEPKNSDALPESASQHEYEPTSNDDDDWRTDDTSLEPQTNHDDDLNESPASSDEDHLTTDEEEEWDPWRRPKSRDNSGISCQPNPSSATAKEQIQVDKSTGSKDGGAAGLDLRGRDRVDLDAADVDDGVDQGAPEVDDGAPDVDDGDDLGVPDVGCDAAPIRETKSSAKGEQQNRKAQTSQKRNQARRVRAGRFVTR